MNAKRIILAAAVGVAMAGSAMANPVAAGFNSTSMGRNDDNFTGAIALGFAVNFYGNTYTSVHVSNNGYLTFGGGQGNYSPVGLGAAYAGLPIIAAFYDDVDTRNAASGITAYGTGTYQGHTAFGATWPGVGYYSNAADRLNAFQVILTDRSDVGAGDFDIYLNYDYIHWDSASTTNSAAVGFNAANGAANSYYEAPGSLVHGAFVDGGPNALAGSNLVFSARAGAPIVQVEPAAVIAPAAVPEPAPYALIGLGIVTAWLARRRRTSKFPIGLAAIA